jgi:hypothetical protein
MSDVQIIKTSTEVYPKLGRYFFAELACGKHSIIVTVAPASIGVTVQNASNRTWRGTGKNFADLDTALAYYKTAAIGAMLKAAVDLARATGQHEGDFFTCQFCDQRIAELEAEGLSTSDAQGCADAEHRQVLPHTTRYPAVTT